MTDHFLVSQAIELVVSKYKSKFESLHNGVVDFVTDTNVAALEDRRRLGQKAS